MMWHAVDDVASVLPSIDLTSVYAPYFVVFGGKSVHDNLSPFCGGDGTVVTQILLKPDICIKSQILKDDIKLVFVSFCRTFDRI